MDRDLVRHLRATLGATQKELADRLGLNQSTVSRWERGLTHPDAEARRRLDALLEGAATQAETSLRLLVTHSAGAMALFDATWRVHALSPAFASLLDVSPAAGIGLDVRRRFTPGLESASRTAVDRGLLTGGVPGLRVVCAIRATGGGERWTDGTWHPLRLEGQERLLVVWQCRPLDAAPSGPRVDDLAGTGSPG